MSLIYVLINVKYTDNRFDFLITIQTLVVFFFKKQKKKLGVVVNSQIIVESLCTMSCLLLRVWKPYVFTVFGKNFYKLFLVNENKILKIHVYDKVKQWSFKISSTGQHISTILRNNYMYQFPHTVYIIHCTLSLSSSFILMCMPI